MRTQVRGAGIVASNLNVRGEEICKKLDPERFTNLKIKDISYLIRGVADADIEIGKLRLHHVSKYHIQTFLRRCSLKTLGDLGRHSRIQFDRDYPLGLLQNFRRQVASTGTDFEDDITLLEVGFVDNPLLMSARCRCYASRSTLTARQYRGF